MNKYVKGINFIFDKTYIFDGLTVKELFFYNSGLQQNTEPDLFRPIFN